MIEITLTQEEIAKSISAAYDSVTLINDLKSRLSLTSEESEELIRNKKHIEIMLSKNWFFNALTNIQKEELQAINA